MHKSQVDVLLFIQGMLNLANVNRHENIVVVVKVGAHSRNSSIGLSQAVDYGAMRVSLDQGVAIRAGNKFHDALYTASCS